MIWDDIEEEFRILSKEIDMMKESIKDRQIEDLRNDVEYVTERMRRMKQHLAVLSRRND